MKKKTNKQISISPDFFRLSFDAVVWSLSSRFTRFWQWTFHILNVTVVFYKPHLNLYICLYNCQVYTVYDVVVTLHTGGKEVEFFFFLKKGFNFSIHSYICEAKIHRFVVFRSVCRNGVCECECVCTELPSNGLCLSLYSSCKKKDQLIQKYISCFSSSGIYRRTRSIIYIELMCVCVWNNVEWITKQKSINFTQFDFNSAYKEIQRKTIDRNLSLWSF